MVVNSPTIMKNSFLLWMKFMLGITLADVNPGKLVDYPRCTQYLYTYDL